NLNPNFVLFQTMTDLTVHSPSKIFTFVDTSPVSVCMPAFVTITLQSYMFHRPTMEHQKASPVAFADGHVEVQRWKSEITYRLAHTTSFTGPSPSPDWKLVGPEADGDHLRNNFGFGNEDAKWFIERCSVPK